MTPGPKPWGPYSPEQLAEMRRIREQHEREYYDNYSMEDKLREEIANSGDC